MITISFIRTKFNYIIPLALFLGSFFVYSFNLEGQPWHGDEINYLGWSGNYINLMKKNNFGNSCLISIDNCRLLYHIPAHGLTYSPLRMLLIGFPMSVKNAGGGDVYNWSCYYFNCYNPHKAPTLEQMMAGRLFSPLFGSLTIAISFSIGNILFNRYIGMVFSSLFLFYDLWLWYSRTIMTEVHYTFFAMLSLLLLLYSFRSTHLSIKYFVLSALTFGCALSSKILAVEFSVLFLGIILFRSLTNGHHSSTANKRYIPKIFLSTTIFFAMAVLSLFLTEPGFYQNPLKEIALMKTDMDNYNHDVWYIGYPTIHGIQTNAVISIFHYALFPSFIEKQMSEPHTTFWGNLEWVDPPTYSSIPLTIFFFVGFGYLIYRIGKFKSSSSEAILIIWFISTFIFTILIVKDFSLERYLLPLTISVIFIASYGFWNFIKNISNNKIKIIFATYLIFAHSTTALSYWQKIYFSPGTMWVNPLHYGTLQESLGNSFTFAVNTTFIVILLFMLVIRFQKGVKVMLYPK